MIHYFIISDSQTFISELSGLVLSKTGVEAVCINLESKDFKPLDYSERILVFNRVCDCIENYMKDYPIADLRESVAIIDAVIKWPHFDPTDFDGENIAGSAYAMLALTFPELRFIFLNNTDWQGNEFFLKEIDNISSKTNRYPIYLFDPLSFRNGIRRNINNADGNSKIRERPKLALSIEDELSYAYFHAYIAYKIGYRCELVTRKQQLDDLKLRDLKVDLQFEDLFLSFPDKEDFHFSNLRTRDIEENYPFLKKAKKRFLVTVGHTHSENHLDNKNYLNSLKSEGHKIKTLYKPSSGIFDFLDKCGLLAKYWKHKRKELKNYRPDKNHTHASHSAPGMLSLIAEKLIYRAHTILKEAHSIPDTLHAAILAIEAKELLGCRTPTMAISALAIQHKAEVMAESMFFGVEYNINLRGRFREIKLEVQTISQWFNRSMRKRQELNARLNIAGILANTFREFNQFEEELSSLRESRKLRFSFRRKLHPLNVLAWPFHKYIEWSLHSIAIFLTFIFSWLILFGGLYFYFSGKPLSVGNIVDSYVASARFFFTLTLNEQWASVFDKTNCIWASVILAVQGIVAFFNLSLLLSHLYLLVSRR